MGPCGLATGYPIQVRDSHANPLGLVCMLHLPVVVQRIMTNCDFEVDLFQDNPRGHVNTTAGGASLPVVLFV